MKGRKEHGMAKHASGGIVKGIAAKTEVPGKKTPPPVLKKSGGAVAGKAEGGRLDKRVRGGRATPTSPFSGADVKD